MLSFKNSTPQRPAGLKLGLRSPRVARDEFADLERLDRPELDEDDSDLRVPSPDEPNERKVA